MSTPDIAARLLLASDEAMADGSARAGRAAQCREPPPPAGRGRDRRAGEEDRRDRPRDRLPHGHRRRRRGLASRRDRHRRLEAGGRVPPAGDRAVDRRRRRARIVPQHPVVQHAGALESCGEVMTKFGGHKQAAGLTIEPARIRELRARVNAYADGCLGPDDLRPRLWIDGALPFRSITAQVASELARSRPSGPATPPRSFARAGVEIVDGPRRIKERHLKMAFKQDGRIMRGIAWRASEREELRHRAPRPRSTWRSRSSRTCGTASGTCSSRWPISRRPSRRGPAPRERRTFRSA